MSDPNSRRNKYLDALKEDWRFSFILIACLALTFTTSFVVFQRDRSEINSRFLNDVNEIERAILDRMEHYAIAIVHTRAFFQYGEKPTRDDFRKFFSAMMVQNTYPGIQGIGYAVRALPRKIPSLEADLRRSGFLSFRLRLNFHNVCRDRLLQEARR